MEEDEEMTGENLTGLRKVLKGEDQKSQTFICASGKVMLCHTSISEIAYGLPPLRCNKCQILLMYAKKNKLKSAWVAVVFGNL